MRGLAQIGDTPHSWPPDGKMIIYNPFKIAGNPFWDERIHRCLSISKFAYVQSVQYAYIYMDNSSSICAVYPYSWCDSSQTVYIVLHGICMFDLLLLLCSACRNTHVMVASELMGKNKVPGIWGGPRCCHFSNILQGGPQNAEKRNFSIRSIFIIIIIIIIIMSWSSSSFTYP